MNLCVPVFSFKCRLDPSTKDLPCFALTPNFFQFYLDHNLVDTYIYNYILLKLFWHFYCRTILNTEGLAGNFHKKCPPTKIVNLLNVKKCLNSFEYMKSIVHTYHLICNFS